MNNRFPLSLLVFAIGSVLVGGVYYYEQTALGELQARFAASELQPVAALLKEDQKILNELRAEPYLEPNSGILESYLAKIRRDGVPKHVDMRQKLEELADNNTAIVTLTKAYAPQAKTPDFTSEEARFGSYAAAWRDRWNSVMELFMAGGSYAAPGAPFPQGFADAVQAELAVKTR
jgi:hypothetical protein